MTAKEKTNIINLANSIELEHCSNVYCLECAGQNFCFKIKDRFINTKRFYHTKKFNKKLKRYFQVNYSTKIFEELL